MWEHLCPGFEQNMKYLLRTYWCLLKSPFKYSKIHSAMKIKRKDRFYVYIVKCANGTFYTGYTNDLESRVKLHNKGNGAKYLKGKLPVKLVYAKEYKYYKNALHAERNIKKLRRWQKQDLIKVYEQVQKSK